MLNKILKFIGCIAIEIILAFLIVLTLININWKTAIWFFEEFPQIAFPFLISYITIITHIIVSSYFEIKNELKKKKEVEKVD